MMSDRETGAGTGAGSDLSCETWHGLEPILELFERALSRGERPPLDAFLPALKPAERQALLAELVHADLEFRLKAAEPTRVEDYLTAYPELRSDAQVILGLIQTEYTVRRGREPALGPEEYQARFPEFGAALARLVTVTPCLRVSAGAGRPARAAGGPEDNEAGARVIPTAPVEGRRLGDYRILRQIGRGGMGVVYEAEQVSLGRRVALKVLPGDVAADSMALARFQREAKAAARLHHTNIVPVYEVGSDGEATYYAMQFIEGQGLDKVIDDLARLSGPGREPVPGGIAETLFSGRLATEAEFPSRDRRLAAVTDPDSAQQSTILATQSADFVRSDPLRTELGPAAAPTASAVLLGGGQVTTVPLAGRRAPHFRSAAQIGRQVAQGLAYAHASGIVHRDIKPSNLLLDRAGIVWIADFGLAKGVDEGLTRTGDIMGTLRYVAPERFRGEGDARADIYALGLSLYELLTLRPAFADSDRLKLIEQIKTEEPKKPRAIDARIPRDLETIVLKAIEKDPKARYQSAEAMAEDLRLFLADEPIRARQVSAWERYRRWARRNPVIAGLGAALGALLVATTVASLLAMERFRTQAENQQMLAANEAAARNKADQANASLRAAQDNLKRTVYATRSNLALAAWDGADVGRLRSLLDLLRPDPGEPDLRGWEWRYLWQLTHEDRLTLRAQEDRFVDVAFSPDGQTLAGLELKGRIQLWDRKSGRLRQTTGVMTEGRRADLGKGISALAFSPDSRSLAGPGPDDCLVLYAVDTGRPTLRFEGAPGAIQKLAWSLDGVTLIAALAGHCMRVWDARDGHLIHKRFGGHGGPIAAVALGPDGRTIASASFDHTVKLWNRDDSTHPSAVLLGHTDEVRAVAFSPDGRRVASAGRDRTVRIWDAKSGAALAVIWGHTNAVLSLAYLPGGARVVTGSADETVRVWDTETGKDLRTFKGHSDGVVAVSVSPEGSEIASASDDATVRIWDADSPPRPRALQIPSVLTYGGAAECLAFFPDGRRLVSGHDDNTVRTWELPSGRPLQVLKGHTDRIELVAISPDGRTIASGGRDRTVRLWDAATGEPRITFNGHSDAIGGLVITPDGQTVLSAGFDRTIQAWDLATGALRFVLRGHSDRIHDLAQSPDGRSLASASRDKTCILWDIPGRRARATLRGHTGEVNAVAFSSDGQALATSSDDRTVRLWNAATGAPQGILKGHLDEVHDLAFSPDGRLASSSWDKTIRLWNPDSGQTLLVFKWRTGRGPCIKFSPDGRLLASADFDRTIKLWEAAPESALATRAGQE
jgi:eukaryotic-like serine/threonine-protein kinase